MVRLSTHAHEFAFRELDKQSTNLDFVRTEIGDKCCERLFGNGVTLKWEDDHAVKVHNSHSGKN